MQTIAITVRGLVQGVYFRHSTRTLAQETGITGTVCNRPDGSVKILATGSSDQLEKLIQWCHKGPSRSVVTSVEVENLPFQAFKGFLIVRND
jgi:acylphosphatase